MKSKLIEHNVVTKVTKTRDYTNEEQVSYDAQIKKSNEEYDLEVKIEETKAKNKSSAITKLKDLGLSDDEITSLIGE